MTSETSIQVGGRGHGVKAGIVFALIAMATLNAQDAMIKWLVKDYPLLQIMFIRSVFMIVPSFLLLHAKGNFTALRTRRPWGHAIRLLLNFAGFLSFFYALSRMPLAEAIALSMTAPLFITLFSALLLREVVRWQCWVAVLIGFAGVLVIVQPDADLDLLGVGAILVFAVCYALWTIQTRHLAETESSDITVFFGAVGFAAITGVTMPFLWVMPAFMDLSLLLLLGVISVAGHYWLAQAYRHAAAHLVAPIEYTSLIWAVIFGFVLFGDVPTFWILPGSLLIVGSGIYIFFQDRSKLR